MANLLPRDVLLFAGGDALAKYGAFVRRTWPADRGGEQAKEVFTRTGTAWALQQNGLLLPSAANQPRVEWAIDPVTGLLQPYLLLEAAATNVVLWNRDMTNAAWTKTTMTAALDQVGIDGGTNTASSLLATAGNATCLQAITLGSAARFQSAWVKRLVGAGTVQMTLDNGATWTAITLTAAWTRVTIPTQTLANPTAGFRLVTNADKIAIDGVQNEAGTFQTSTIFTTTAAVTRNAESFSLPWYDGAAARWIYTRHIERGSALGSGTGTLWAIGNAGANGTRLLAQAGGPGAYNLIHGDALPTTVNSQAAASPTYGQVVELLHSLFADGSVQIRQSLNGGAETAAAQSGVLALRSTWDGVAFWLNSLQAANVGYAALSRLLVGMGPGTLVSTIADARQIIP